MDKLRTPSSTVTPPTKMDKLGKKLSHNVWANHMSNSDECDHSDNINVQKRNKKCAVYLTTLLKHSAMKQSVLPQEIKYWHFSEKHTTLCEVT